MAQKVGLIYPLLSPIYRLAKVSALYIVLSQIGDKLSNLISCGSIASGGLIFRGSADLSAEPVAAS